jgi:hypothetical protein
MLIQILYGEKVKEIKKEFHFAQELYQYFYFCQ